MAELRLTTQFVSSVPKDNQDPAHNDDSYCVSDDKQRWSLSDGASESYNPALWSRILAAQWIRTSGGFSRARVRSAIEKYQLDCNYKELSWSKKAAYDRGSFATLLGVALRRNGCLKVVAAGDSLVVMTNGPKLIQSFPYREPNEFDQRPELVSTRAPDNECFWLQQGRAVKRVQVTWRLSRYEDPHVLCMTDALGKWFLANELSGSFPTGMLLEMDSPVAFEEFVIEERAAGRMRRDDTTLLVLSLER